MDEWVAVAKKEGPEDEKRRAEWLQEKRKFTTLDAVRVSGRADGKRGGHEDAEAYRKAAVRSVGEQYSGAKEELRPIYDALLTLGRSPD